MANQILGTCTFTRNPGQMTIIRPDRYCSHVQTYSSVGFFSWGASIVGKIVELRWTLMPIAQYEAIQNIWETDAEVVFDPKDGESLTYDVEILDFYGEYCVGVTSAETRVRKNIVLRLLVLSSDPYP